MDRCCHYPERKALTAAFTVQVSVCVCVSKNGIENHLVSEASCSCLGRLVRISPRAEFEELDPSRALKPLDSLLL